MMLVCLPALGSGARYVTGPPFFTGQPGVPVGWKGPGVVYYTDPGALSATVTHAQADALVAAAAGVWNVPVASITLSQGGLLAEHVSGANVYLGSGGMVYPDDVSSANSAARPIAVIYDTDGSVTDTLLGLGASSPSSCRQNAVFESVDQFDPAGYIEHAIVVLNGRCTSSSAAAQLEMQYKLERVFGRVLGLAWSQANDNVFTGLPVPTYAQAQFWPMMHPVEIICGTYAYTCMPSPFTLRPDDVASLVLVYPITTAAGAAAAGTGKAVSLAGAGFAYGTVGFPTGEGMAGVNVLVTRDGAGSATSDGWVTASGISGAVFRRNGTSVLVAPDTSAWGSMGLTSTAWIGVFSVPYVPFPSGQSYVNMHVRTEAINPLYTGQYSVGPYGVGIVAPSGSTPAAQTTTYVTAANSATANFVVPDAASPCGNGTDGEAGQPVPVAASGWWTGLLCGYGHASYLHLPVRAGRTFTVEVTALDANGLATTTKLMPVMGLWGPGDSAGSLPTQGVAAAAFGGRGVGMSTLAGATGTMTEMVLGIADQRGDGRPDYVFAGRFFYADSVLPVQLPAAGGVVTVFGAGFKAGNAVYVNGVAGTVTAWTQTSLTVTLPGMAAAGVASGTAVEVKVMDLSTGAVSTMAGAITYVTGAPSSKTMKLETAEVADVVVGTVAPVPFAVKVLAADGVTPVAGEPVVFSFGLGSGSFGTCGGARCTVVTDANGSASTTVTPGATGEITMLATDGALQQTASFNGLANNSRVDVIEAPGGTQTVGAVAQPDFLIRVFGPDGGSPAVGRTITWTVTAGSAILSGCFAPVCATSTASNGVTSIQITPLLPGVVTVTATDGQLVQTTSFQAVLSLDTMTVTSVPVSPVYAGVSAGMFGLRLVKPNGYGDYYQPVVFSGPAGVTFDQCGTNPCTLGTDSQGNTGASVTPNAAGTFTVTATFGTGVSAISQTATVTATVKTVTRLRIVSLPGNNQPVGQYTDKPFAAQVFEADGATPAANTSMTLSGASGSVAMECGRAACLMITDATGTASMRLIPLHAGPISLSAAAVPYTATGTFTAVAAGKLMTVVTQPASPSYAGDVVTLGVQVMQPDGVTPAAGDTVVFSVGSGEFSFAGCAGSGQTAGCTAVTDAAGRASLSGTATLPGAVTLAAADGTVSQSVSFTAVGRADSVQVVQAPSGKVTAGGLAAAPFQVRVLLADGMTPAAGRTVQFAISMGYASFGACPAASCTVTTDSNGLAQTTVSTTVAGAVTLEAIDTSPGQTAYALASFTAVGAGDGLRVVSAPDSSGTIYNIEALPLTVQVVGPDGTTPVPGQNVTLSTTVGNTGTTLCSGGPGCVAVSDAQGMVSTLVRPLTSGLVTMQFTDGPLVQSVSFTVQRQPDTLSLVSGPADGSFVGGPAAVPFAVKVVQADGTAAAGRSVTMSVTSGGATLGACGTASCTVTADAKGIVSSGVVPSAAGSVALLLTDGTVQLPYSFQAVARADALAVVSAPASGGLAGAVAAPAFAVRVTGGYAAGALAGRTVAFSVVSGTAALGCGTATCAVVSGANGLASVAVTPGAAGTVVLRAADGNAVVQVQFQVMAAHGLKLVSVPADESFVGTVATPLFGVQVVLADGVTPVMGDSVSVSVTNGTVCGAASCVGISDAQGMVRLGVTPAAAGVVGVSAVEGMASVSASFVAQVKPDVLSLVNAPSGTGTVGVVMPGPFSVRLLAGDGSPRAGVAVVFSVSAGSASLGACSASSTCSLLTDAAGLASTSVTPTGAGSVSLSAAAEGMTVSASFLAKGSAPDVLSVVSAPSGTGTVAVVMPGAFSVRLLAGDGSPRAGVAVVFSVTSGSASFGGCPAACSVLTDASGLASVTVTPLAAGAVSVSAGAEGMTVSASFMAKSSAPDVLSVVSAPSGTGTVGVVMPGAFSVRLLAADGTPRAGVAVVFSISAGNASLGACPAASTCSLLTDAAGLASTSVTPTGAGSVFLSAGAEGMTVSASFGAVAAPDLLAVVQGAGARVFVGDSTQFAVRLVLPDGVTPAAGVSVVFSAGTGAGQVSLDACGGGICAVTTDAHGIASTGMTGVQPGGVTVMATPDARSRATAVSVGVEVLANVYGLVFRGGSGPLYVAEAVGFRDGLQVLATRNGAPAAGVAVSWTGSGGVSVRSADAVTDGSGGATVLAVFGPLSAGAAGAVEACAWTGVCAEFDAVGVANAALGVSVVSGGAQQVPAGQAPAALVAQVTDGAGHAVAGAAVTVFQTMYAAAACPSRGRCPATAVLGTRASVVVSGVDGTVTVVPLSDADTGSATETKVEFTVGTAGVAMGDVVVVG